MQLSNFLLFYEYIVASKENQHAIYENWHKHSFTERKMEKVISLLAPRAGSPHGRLVPRPAKKRKEAAWLPCCERTHVHNRLVSINGDACNCCCERSIASRWIPEEETRGRHATMRRK